MGLCLNFVCHTYVLVLRVIHLGCLAKLQYSRPIDCVCPDGSPAYSIDESAKKLKGNETRQQVSNLLH